MSTPNTHYGAERISEMLRSVSSIYFIGIGGINVSSLALVAKKRGYKVGGSDRAESELTRRLADEGINIFGEHRKENIEGYGAVVYTVAISEDNPEYLEAKRKGIPCISRADFMGYVMTGYARRIGVSGMHGKSTCTSMFATVFMLGKRSPTVLSGAELSLMGGAYTIGSGEEFIFEACEYMDSFLDFNPTVAVILNVEMDHVDYFHSIEQIRRSFADYAAITGEDGYAVANADDENVRLSLSDYKGTLVTFGIDSQGADYRAVNISSERGRYSFDVLKKGERFCHISLSVTGYHNIYNALATVAAADICGLDVTLIESGLKAFVGAKRRMEYRGELDGALLYEDYGHHPSEVSTTLSGARALARGRLVCVFQPHTYSRTKALFDEFAGAFEAADRVLVSDIYAAREINDGSVSSEALALAIGDKASYSGNIEMTARALSAELCEGDTAIIMGAGDIYKVFDLLSDQSR